MLLQRAHAVLFMLLGAVSLADGWRISQQAREVANFDAIGPDRYLLALGALMIAGGLWRLLGAGPHAAGARREPGAAGGGRTFHLALTLVLLAGVAALTPVLGFSLACLLFLAAELQLLAGWPWWKSVATSAAAALAFHAAFVWLADMPLPKGWIWG